MNAESSPSRLRIPTYQKELLIVYKFMERCASRIWKCGIAWILLFISRRVSGISKAEDVDLDPSSSDAEVRRKHKCCGYYGWGKIAVVLDADVLCDRVRVEFSNMSLVAALFLTFTVPLLVDPPDAIMLYTNESSFPGFNPRLVQSLYVTFSSIAVAYQLTTVTTALLMITNLNKCQASSGESGVLFIKSIFSPYNGITGTIGPALYIATTLSVCATIWVTMLTCFAPSGYLVDTVRSGYHFLFHCLRTAASRHYDGGPCHDSGAQQVCRESTGSNCRNQ